jgi:hypothetical protein
MKSLSKQSITLIVLATAAVFVVGVFAYQNRPQESEVVEVVGEEEQENQNTSDQEFVTDVDMNIEHWQTKETEFFTIKFPKEWYWLESNREKTGYYSQVITNNSNFDIDRYADIGLFSDIGPNSIIEIKSSSEIVISFRGSPTTNAGTPQDRLDSIFELAKKNNSSVECEVINNKTVPFTAYCSVEYDNLQLQRSYYTINEEISLTSTARTNQESVVKKEIFDKIAKSIVLKTGLSK